MTRRIARVEAIPARVPFRERFVIGSGAVGSAGSAGQHVRGTGLNRRQLQILCGCGFRVELDFGLATWNRHGADAIAASRIREHDC